MDQVSTLSRGKSRSYQPSLPHELTSEQSGVLVIEIGAGTAVPTVRATSEQLVRNRPDSFLIRINVNEAKLDRLNSAKGVCLPMKGLIALKCLKHLVSVK